MKAAPRPCPPPSSYETHKPHTDRGLTSPAGAGWGGRCRGGLPQSHLKVRAASAPPRFQEGLGSWEAQAQVSSC
jgi:hypothetical protein